MKEYENYYYNEGYNYIGGTDEAGRGPLVGPVVCACVVFPKDYENDEINDSKKLTEKKREKLYDIIMKDALSVGVSIISNKTIDEINILEASRLGMKKAYEYIGRKRGCLVRGNEVDYNKVSNIIIKDLRDGYLGKVTFDERV